MQSPHSAVVVLGGGRLPEGARQLIPPDALVVAADSGAAEAIAIGLRPDVVVGDGDSLDPAAEAALVAAGVTFERHPTNKDATDGELALIRARASGAVDIVLVTAGDIDRFDHLLAAVGALATTDDSATLTMYVGTARIERARPDAPVTLAAPLGSTVSLLALFGPVEGVTTSGLQWPLVDARLIPGSTHGVSNIVERSQPTISVTQGTLLVITPEAFS